MEKVWVDYRVHGWKVDRFGIPLKDISKFGLEEGFADW
jgi:hypothetical protein